MAEGESKTPKEPAKIELAKEIKLPTAVLALDVTADGKTFYAACLDGGIYETNAESGDHALLHKHESYASGVWLLPKAQCLISAGYDGALHWFDLATRKLTRKTAAHKFWSWQMAVSPNERLAASVTGQYLTGGYKYEPSAEREPSVKVYDTATGELKAEFSHVPPVLSVCFSPDSRFLAAGNMMGEVRVWDVGDNRQVASWTTPDFTSWGIIKSHHYIGGIFSLAFSPDGDELFLCGMGPMRDPMAGNGKQTWQRFYWREQRKMDAIHEGEHGNGLMETIYFHPSHPSAFVMAGRLAQGKWNLAFFDRTSGKLLHSLDTKFRVTDSVFAGENGSSLFLAGATGQAKKMDGKYPPFGRVKIYRCDLPEIMRQQA